RRYDRRRTSIVAEGRIDRCKLQRFHGISAGVDCFLTTAVLRTCTSPKGGNSSAYQESTQGGRAGGSGSAHASASIDPGRCLGRTNSGASGGARHPPSCPAHNKCRSRQSPKT